MSKSDDACGTCGCTTCGWRLAALERRVRLLEIRAGVLRDERHHRRNRRVLALLHGFARSPINDGSFTMTPTNIADATGLDANQLGIALNELQRAEYIESTHIDSTGHWRITDDGSAAIMEVT